MSGIPRLSLDQLQLRAARSASVRVQPEEPVFSRICGHSIFRPIFTLPFSESISCGFFFGAHEHPDARIGLFGNALLRWKRLRDAAFRSRHRWQVSDEDVHSLRSVLTVAG